MLRSVSPVVKLSSAKTSAGRKNKTSAARAVRERAATFRNVQELQSIAQQFPEDRKAGAEVTLPNASK